MNLNRWFLRKNSGIELILIQQVVFNPELGNQVDSS